MLHPFIAKGSARTIPTAMAQLMLHSKPIQCVECDAQKQVRPLHSYMGCSQSWIAIKDATAEVVLGCFGLRLAGSGEEAAASKFEGARLRGGWYIVVIGRSSYESIRQEKLRELSAGRDVLAGDVEEHVMVSTAAGWRDGKEVWCVVHDAQQGIDHLMTRGQLPAEFTGIRDRQMARQNAAGPDPDVDYIFDIPVDLTRAITGYHYSADLPGVDFDPLVEAPPPKGTSWLCRLFGK